jgi:hypothetical protein
VGLPEAVVTLRVVGHHCYAGGFLLGLKRQGHEVLGTVETWKPGARMASWLGLPVNAPLTGRRAHVVVSNPPCSRFSVMSHASYTDAQRADVGAFCELGEVVPTLRQVGARVLWWETGPLAATRGLGVIRSTAEAVGARETAVVSYDCRYGGSPQRRPRTHVLHFLDDVDLPSVSYPGPRWPPERTALSWLEAARAASTLREDDDLPVVPRRSEGQRKRGAPCPGLRPLSYVDWAKSGGIRFDSAKPRVVGPEALYFPAVLGQGKPWLLDWDDGPEWATLGDMCAVMGYPSRAVAGRKVGLDVQTLLAKSVSPDASERVCEWVLEPALLRGRGCFERLPEERDGLVFFDMTVKDQRRARAAQPA